MKKALWIALLLTVIYVLAFSSCDRGDASYKVEYYLQDANKAEYDVIASEEEHLTGAVGSTVYAEQKTFEHFTLNSDMSDSRGRVRSDGSLVLKLYYDRNEYRLSAENEGYGSITNEGSYPYGSSAPFKTCATPNLGYNFLGWYSEETLLSTEPEYTFNIDKNVVAKFAVTEEMKDFFFSSTETECTVSGLKNKSAAAVVIPDYVTVIRDWAFYRCKGLTDVTIGNGVISIGDLAFYECSSLTELTVGNDVISIGAEAFSECSRLTSITIPNSVTSIGNLAFYGCKGLTDVTLGNGVISIGEAAFSKCSSLTSITIPNSVISIGDAAFNECSSLTELTVGKGVKDAGLYMFCDCTALEEIYFNATEMNDLCDCNCAFTNAGKDKSGIKVVIGSSVTRIPSFLFSPNASYSAAPKITSIEFEDNSVCEVIGIEAFKNCGSLKEIIFPDSVTSVGDGAFYDCLHLEEVTIGSRVTSIGQFAFYGCPRLEHINYRGTEEQWESISKDSNWISYPYTITYNYQFEE